MMSREEYVKNGYTCGWSFTPLRGKIPTTTGWQAAPRETLEQALTWARAGNVGLRTGAVSGVVVVDVDEAKGGRVPDGLSDTVTVRTGGGGVHIYFALPAGVTIRNSVGKIAPNVDVRGERGQVVFPGSVHPDTGEVYEWVQGKGPADIPLAPFPVWLLERERKPIHGRSNRDRSGNAYLKAALQGECDAVAAATEGTRNDRLNQASFALGGFVGQGLDEDEIAAALLDAAVRAGLPEHEARTTIASGLRAGAAHPRPIPESARQPRDSASVGTEGNSPPTRLTELAAAERLRAMHGHDLRHDSSLGWLVWDGRRWARNTKAAERMAHGLGQMVRNEAKDIRDPEVAREYFRFAKRLETAMCIDAVLKLARALRGIDADGETFDAPPWLLNCPNGTVDLSTGRLRLHRREDFLTKLCPTPYKPGTPCPRWQQFLREVFDGDDDLISYVQWLSGYSLTGSTEHQVFAILYGSGANGKSTFIGALHRALGSDYATNLDPETLLAQHTPRHSTDLAALHGARLATAHETADGRRLNESLIKQLTGGDRIRARFVCQDSFEFSPQLKLWLCTNHRPTIRDDTHGMWRRVRLISFRVQFDGTKCDPSLARSLAEEASGILAWAVEGAKRCAAYGEPALPSAVRAATENYRAELDTLAEFLDTETEMWEHASVRKNALYQAYSNSLNGRCENQRAFAERMRAKGFCEGRDKDGRLIWRGLRLRILAPEDADRS